MQTISAYGYFFDEPGRPLRRDGFSIDTVARDEVVVEVAGCGLCHTDLTFYSGAVKARRMPVILGHEISGRVVEAGDGCRHLAGKDVVVPAVLPCGTCDLCTAGRANVCRRQKMPGNDFDGGFASHVVVPGRDLCVVPEKRGGLSLAELSVVADAITTPYQALLRSGLRDGELAIVIGVGGIGTYMVQLAASAGATVVAIDVDEKKLANASRLGAAHTIDASGLGESDIKKAVRSLVGEHGLPPNRWRVFETSGTAAGQRSAFALLSFAGTLGVVGFTMDKVEVRLSNVMAFDADIFGNWGCKPEHYPKVVEAVVSGRINVRDNIEQHPLDAINDIFGLANEHKLDKRVVFVPRSGDASRA